MQDALMARQVELEAELGDVRTQLTTARSQMAEGASREGQLMASLATAEAELASLRQEHMDYRHKAAAILQVGLSFGRCGWGVPWL